VSAVGGKVCAVTGAGSGIGRALAVELARRGARVAISDIDPDGLTGTSAAIGRELHVTVVDVADRDAVEAWAAAVAGHHGVVHQIYNNAGIAFSRPVLESEYEDFEQVLAVNLWGVIHGTKAFLPHVIASGDGHVTSISSVNGFFAQSRMSHYCASKFAVRGFSESLRSEMLAARHHVGVTVVHPGGVKTNIADAALDEARKRGFVPTDADLRRHQTFNEKILRMAPEQAARIIVDGVEGGRARVLVGNDARLIDAIVRLLPGRYPRVAVALERRLRR